METQSPVEGNQAVFNKFETWSFIIASLVCAGGTTLFLIATITYNVGEGINLLLGKLVCFGLSLLFIWIYKWLLFDIGVQVELTPQEILIESWGSLLLHLNKKDSIRRSVIKNVDIIPMGPWTGPIIVIYLNGGEVKTISSSFFDPKDFNKLEDILLKEHRTEPPIVSRPETKKLILLLLLAFLTAIFLAWMVYRK